MATKLFIGNLSWSTTNDTLAAFFAQFGTVVSATVITDKFSGRSKGFGFVEMSSEEEAKNAQEQGEGKDLDGRAIAIAEARPQQPRENNYSGGSRGGFDKRGGGNRYDRGGDRGGDRNRR